MKFLLILSLIGSLSLKANCQLVIDDGEFLTGKEKSDLIKIMKKIRDESTVETLVYTTFDLHGSTPKDYAMELSTQYPVGVKGINNGVVLLLSKYDRKFQILNGFGLEWILTDSVSDAIFNLTITHFSVGKFYEGLREALTQIGEKVTTYDWTIKSRDLTDLSANDINKIVKFVYTHPKGNIKYKYALSSDPQFSVNFKIGLNSPPQGFELYYTKYMNEMVAEILTKSKITIYARLTDGKNKRLELLGIEVSR